MQKIAVFFDQPNFDDYPFDEAEYYDSYHELARLIATQGGEFFIARSDASYLGALKFSGGWKWDGDRFAPVGEFAVDVIYDKSNSALTPPFRFEVDNRILNPNPIVEICNDKFKTHILFEEFSPRMTIALDETQVANAVRETRGKRMVLKPLNAEGGAGVVIGDAEKLRSAKKNFPVLISEFIDTSEGIPQVVGIDSHHDFRMIVIDGEIIQSFARTPPKGSLTANVAQGGATHEIALAQIPPAARALAKKIDAKFASYPRAYSIDLGFEDRTPKLIELNSQPALFSQKRGASFVDFQKKLANALLNF